MVKIELIGKSPNQFIHVVMDDPTNQNYFSGAAPSEELTTLQAEDLIKKLRSAIDKVRMANQPRKKLGEY